MADTNLKFDAETHTYTLNGVKLPSVTEIISPLYDFSRVNPDILERSRLFGTAVHSMIKMYLDDNLDTDTLDEALKPCLEAYRKFQGDNLGLLAGNLQVEVPNYHKSLLYAGTPDLISEEFVIDIKTRKYNPLTDSLQLAAYAHFDGKNRQKRYILELKQDSDYILTAVKVKKPDEANNRFRYLLDFYRMNEQINLWRLTK